MEVVLSQQRLAIPLGACAIGLAVFWLAKTPFGLLAPTAVLFLFARGTATLSLHTASVIGLATGRFGSISATARCTAGSKRIGSPSVLSRKAI